MTEDEIRKALRDHTRITVRGSDYKFEGTLLALFYKLNGALRVVVENDFRVLSIESPRYIEPLAKAEDKASCQFCGSEATRLTEGYDMANDKKMTQTLCLNCGKVRAQYVE